MITPDKWRWLGSAGHLCVGRFCRFHLCTIVGEYMVSTVGAYVPPEGSRNITAKFRGVELEGMGAAREADYLDKLGYEDIGAGRKYETMVFKVEEGAACVEDGCLCGGAPTAVDWFEKDFAGYKDSVSATKGHMDMCLKWAQNA